MSEFTPNDLSFLMQYILEFTFFSTELMFSFQFNLSKTAQQQYLYVGHVLSWTQSSVIGCTNKTQIKRRSNSD